MTSIVKGALALGVALIVVASLSPVGAQSNTTGALIGKVMDEGKAALPGTVVQIESESLIGGARTLVTAADGRFRFADIPPGTYTITASLSGYRTTKQTQAQVFLGRTLDISLTLTKYAGEETVTVTEAPSEIDKTSTATSTVFTDTYLQNLPTARFQPDTLNLAPGINNSSAYGGGGDSANSYQIDGVDVSDPDSGTPWSFFNYNIIESVQLVGLGAPAEYGGFTGVAFNSITRSGSNDVSGMFEFLFTNGSLTGNNLPAGETAETSVEKSWDTTAQVGGPFIQDKLWYFVSAQYLSDETLQGGTPRTEKDPRLFAKLTWQASPKDKVEGFLEWDRYDITGRGGDAFTPLEATVTEDAPEYVWNVAWTRTVSPDTVFDVRLTGYWGYYYLDPQNGYDTAGHLDFKTGLYNTNSYYFFKADRDRNQIVSSLTHHASDFIKGDHDFKFGMEIERSTVKNSYGYPTGRWFYDNYNYYPGDYYPHDYYKVDDPGTPGYDPSYYSVTYNGGGYVTQSRNERLSVYAQDAWQITPRVNINAGVRLDMNRGKLMSGDLVFNTNPVAPRIGLSWDLTGDGKTLLKAHYGRYYEALFGAYYYWLTPDSFPELIENRVFPSGFEDFFASVRATQFSIADNIRQPRVDQYILGIDRELTPGFTLSLTGVYRENKDFIETVSRDGDFLEVSGVSRETGLPVTLFDYLNPDEDTLIIKNVPELHRKYKGAILTGTKRLSHNWQLMASYVYAKVTGNVDSLSFSSTLGGNTPSSWLDTPNSLANSEGRLSYDNTHQVKLQGQYVVPQWNMTFSGSYAYITGDTWTRRDNCLLVDDGGGGTECYDFNQGNVRFLAEPRGSQRLPARNELDLRAEWFKGLKSGRLGLMVDVFNVFNQSRPTDVSTIGSTLGEPLTYNFPRNIRVGMRYSF